MNLPHRLIGSEYLGLQVAVELPHEEVEHDLHLFFNKTNNTFFAIDKADEANVWESRLLVPDALSNDMIVSEVMSYRFGNTWKREGLTCTLVDVWMQGSYTTGMHRLWDGETEDVQMDNPHSVVDYLFDRFDEESVNDALNQHGYDKV